MEPTEHRRRNDIATGIALRSERRRTGRTLPNRPVWPPVVEVANILSQRASWMALAEDEHEVQTLGSGRPDPSLGDGVGARRSEWGPDLCDAEIVQPPIEHP
jgi:hypothetical protein